MDCTKILNSIIIPVFGNEDLLHNLLATLLPTIDQRCEIIVVDDGLDDMKINPTNLPECVKYLSTKINGGYSYAVNIGISHSKGDYITTINSDILLDENWLIQTRETFKIHLKVGMVGAMLIYPSNGRIQGSGKVHNANLIISLFRMRKPDELPSQVFEVHTISDALATMPKSVIMEVGMYDERYINAYDDLDLCLKMRKIGYKILCNPAIIGYHHTSASKDFRYAHADKASELFFSTWQDGFNDNLYDYYEQAVSEFTIRNNTLPNSVFIVDICRKTPICLSRIFRELSSVNVLQEYNYREKLQSISMYEQKIDIDLLKTLPFSLLSIQHPIVYIVDSFFQLKENYYWALKRNNQSDIIFDSNFNIYMLNEIVLEKI
jgi:GT2 family glycosyltransferase